MLYKPNTIASKLELTADVIWEIRTNIRNEKDCYGAAIAYGVDCGRIRP